MTIKKKRNTRKNPYPKNRKKKRQHVQWMDFERVSEDWQMTYDYFYMFIIDDDWWACQPGSNFYENIDVNGSYYRPVYKAKFYDGQQGDIVIGYVGVIIYSNMSIHTGRFVFVKNSLMAGHELTRSLSFKRDDHFEYYKKFEIWKTTPKDSLRPVNNTGSEKKQQTNFPAHPDIPS